MSEARPWGPDTAWGAHGGPWRDRPSSSPGPERRPRTMPPSDLVADLAGPALDQAGRLGSPVRLVGLDDDGGSASAVAEAARAAAGADGVLVGVCTRGLPHPSLRPLAAALDFTLVPWSPTASRELIPVADPWRSAVEIAAIVASYPHSASVLAGLLRWSGTLGIREGLDAESLAYSTLLGGPEFSAWLAARGPRPLPPPAVGD